MGIWFFDAKKHKNRLEKAEKIFIKNLNLTGQQKLNASFKTYRIRV